MTGPQIENGFIKIATELWEEFAKIRIPGEARQCLDWIIRKTYGWNKKSDKIPLSQFVENLGIKRQNVIRSLNRLRGMNMIYIIKEKKNNCYGINKNYKEWVRDYVKPRKSKTTKEVSLLKRCYICGFDEVLETHHIIPRSKNGNNTIKNKINLCPNCHTLVHKG
jgi:phage replication O-like protein O